ncbi:MAG: hypothetical protein GX846_00310, partial [Deltaproteobacteria bacterium]|nr:hypothetical protein [Deltaproteobacteria bacterium]
HEVEILGFNRELDQYYCVEIPGRVGLIYAFRVWQVNRTTISILAKDKSRFLTYIRVNGRYNMKYYSTDDLYPYHDLVTRIVSIIPQEGLYLRGHVLIELEIEEKAGDA